MIYPTLEINQYATSINIIDTDYENNPILSMSENKDDEDTFGVFITLLTAFLNQYNRGYEDAIDDGAFGEDEIFY